MWEGYCPLTCFKIKSRAHLILTVIEQGSAKQRAWAWPPGPSSVALGPSSLPPLILTLRALSPLFDSPVLENEDVK